MYHNWAGKRILQLLKNTEEELSPEANKLLMSEALKLSRMVQAHLAHSKSSAVVKTWCWNLMQLICIATKNGQEALAVLNESVTEDVIGKQLPTYMYSSFLSSLQLVRSFSCLVCGTNYLTSCMILMCSTCESHASRIDRFAEYAVFGQWHPESANLE